MLIVGKSKHGYGLFAAKYFTKGSVTFKLTGRTISFQQTLELGTGECYPVQTNPDEYIDPDDPYRYINHSCEPNCGMIGNLDFVALRDIAAGEELLFDYSTSMLEDHWTLTCCCESASCRGLIKDFDLLPRELQIKYLGLGIVVPFIVRQIGQGAPLRRHSSDRRPDKAVPVEPRRCYRKQLPIPRPPWGPGKR